MWWDAFGLVGEKLFGVARYSEWNVADQKEVFPGFRARGGIGWELVDEESVEVLSVCWRLFHVLGINMVHSRNFNTCTLGDSSFTE